MAVGSATYAADGFMAHAPTVGSSVTYDVHSTMTMDENEEITDAEVTLSCVGKEDTDDGSAYWIELKRPNDYNQIVIYKMLIGEKAFAVGTSPLAEVIRGYVKSESEESARDLEEAEEGTLVEHWVSPIPFFDKVEGDGTETVEVEALGRKVECKTRKGEGDAEIFNGMVFVMSNGDLWLSDDVPFGVVKANVTIDLEFGETEFTGESTIVVKKIETKGVKSLLPDSK